ncbi:MAG: PhnD/SsuA/transferrin family substrate-binding protein [Cyanobacteria bacterium P01_E01_bin.6]
MTKRLLFLVIGFVIAIALHRGVLLSSTIYPSLSASLSVRQTHLHHDHGVHTSGFVAPLTWLSSPDIRVQTLTPGVATQVLAAARISNHKKLTLGILVPEHDATQLEEWASTIHYLSQAVDGYSFSLVGMTAQELHTAVAHNTVDFIVTEPGFYVSAESQYAVNCLATLHNLVGGKLYTVLGGVIFSQEDRHDIETLEDLIDKTFAGVDENSIDGWQMVWREFMDHGIDPYQQLRTLSFLHKELDVVTAVKSGRVDAGMIRADSMQRLLESGFIHPSDFKIINQNDRSNLSIPVSTRLYPEWPFSALSHIPSDLAQQVTVALLSMEPTSEAAQRLNIAGWSIPLNYQPVTDLFKQLRLAPYQSVEAFNLRAVIWHYKRWIFTTLGLLFMGTTTIYIQRREITKRKRSELKLQQSQAELTQRKVELENTVAKLQNTQAQLIQTEKMSSLGQLMAGIAHEINNPVNFIHGNINYACRYIEDLLKLLDVYRASQSTAPASIQDLEEEIDVSFVASDLPKLLQSMQVGSERIREIVQSLRVFSRSDEADLKTVDIHQGIDSTLLILGSRLKTKPDRPSIHLVRDYGDLPPIECYAGPLNQVFMNILSNAIDALDEMIEISAREHLNGFQSATNQNSASPTIWIKTDLTQKGWVQIRIKNNGPSISLDTQRQLFNPFFTTKPVGHGTGLGLSISYQIVAEKHGGYLRCLSEPGEGVEFIVEIPMQRKQPPVQSTVASAMYR